MDININSVSGNTIDFDIIGKGNVFLDSEVGYFKCKSYDEELFADDYFYDFILENIDEIIEIVYKPTLAMVKKDLDNLKSLKEGEILELLESDQDYEDLYQWCVNGLERLILDEDYERCISMKRIMSYLDL